MSLAAGTKLGPYEIQSPAGAGGMGEVYRARDTRIDRIVAIKILPAHLADKPEARERFEREARAISQLSHANICQLYDLGQQDGVHYIVMEFLEGETLATRLAKGRLPLEQVLRYGAEIAEGLDQAHRSGVVHRDLKPGNIMLTRSGAKLMDFGLAKRATPATPQSSGLSATLTSADASHPLTAEGTILGTYQYMSPEQVEGKDADARSDIFSFGAVLYEMAAGKRAFDGKSQLSVASAILEREPEPISTVQPMAPPALQHVLQGALMKDPESRWQSAADIARQLRWISSPESSSGGARPALPHAKRLRERVWWAASVVALLGVVSWLAFFARPHPRVVRAYLTPPPGVAFDFVGDFSGPPVLSRDGTRVAFAARAAKDRSSIWVRSLDGSAAEKLAGTEGVYAQFWSADGKFLGFFADSKLKKIPASGGPVTVLADAPNARGGAWNADNVIVYAPDYRDCLWKINAGGGVPARATKLDPSKHSTHRWPSFLPDGKHFLFFATNHAGGRREDNGIYMGSLDSDGASQLVLANDAGGLYSSGYLLFHQQSALMAQKFDPARGTLSGEPSALANDVQVDSGTFHTVFTVADSGVLLYEPGSSSMVDISLLWMDRNGKVLGPIAEPSGYRGGQLSPDGKRLAIAMGDPKSDIWIFDLTNGARTRLTFDDATHTMPSWSADGQRVAFMVQSGATTMSGSSLHARLASGGGQDELLLDKDPSGNPVTLSLPQWSPDGRYLVYMQQSGPTGASVWALPASAGAKPQLLVKPETASGKVTQARISPDGRWLVYSANDGGREEIYVTSFPEGNGRWQVSRTGGTFPIWRRDSKEICFIGLDANVHAVEVSAHDNRFEVGNSEALFELRYTFPLGAPFDLTPDGKRFMMLMQREGSAAPMMLVLNWTGELK